MIAGDYFLLPISGISPVFLCVSVSLAKRVVESAYLKQVTLLVCYDRGQILEKRLQRREP